MNTWLFAPRTGLRYAKGTTVPFIAPGYRQAVTGLLLPEQAFRGPEPADLLATYLTGQDVTGSPIPLELVMIGLRLTNRTSVLLACSNLLAAWEEKPIDVERDVNLAANFRAPFQGRIVEGVRAGRALFSLQAILILAKLALQVCPPSAADSDSRLRSIPVWLLAIQDALERDQGPTEDLDGVVGDPRAIAALIRTSVLGTRVDFATLMAVFQLRWRDLPEAAIGTPGHVDLEGAFSRATGARLDDFLSVGIALWAAASQGLGNVLSSRQLSLRLSRERVRGALRLISATPGTLRVAIQVDDRDFGPVWSFDALRRYPIVRLRGGGLLVLSRRLLLERLFGGIRYDVEWHLRQQGQPRLAERAMGFWQRMCEDDARHSLAAFAPEREPFKRLYSETELQAAFGIANQTADIAIDYPDEWIVCEVTTSKLSRKAIVAGSMNALSRDLGRTVDAKAGQLNATIMELQRDESRLTGRPALSRTRFVPVLVMAEGFPVNPITTSVIRERLAKAGLLRGPRIAPLHVIDREELSFVEGLVATGVSFADLLRRHEQGAFRQMSLRDWLVVEAHLNSERPKRLDGPFERAWQPVLRAIAPDET